MAEVNSAMEGGKEFKPLKFKLGKPGDIIKGTLLSKEYKEPTDATQKPYWETDVQVEICQYYDLVADEAGNYLPVADQTVLEAGKTIKLFGGRKELDELISNSNIGDIIGVQFVEYKKGKGPKPFKIVLAKNFGKDPNYKEPIEAAKEILGGEEVATTDAEAAAAESPAVDGVKF